MAVLVNHGDLQLADFLALVRRPRLKPPPLRGEKPAAHGLDGVIALMRQFEVLDLLPNPLLLSSRLAFRRGDWARARITAHEAMSLVSSSRTRS